MRRSSRATLALLFLVSSAAIWFVPDDLVALVALQKPVLLGRYSLPGFVARGIATPLLWLVALGFASRLPLASALGRSALIAFSSALTILVVMPLSRLVAEPRYLEREAADLRQRLPAETRQKRDRPSPTPEETDEARELQLRGVVRYRRPNQRSDFVYKDTPSQHRSYPDAPPGYGKVPITLTSDDLGFRNPVPRLDRYDILVVGDSFAVGSTVSDEQAWPRLLAEDLGVSVYSVAVSGAEAVIYLNNFKSFGVDVRPSVAIFMIYEGNDFSATGNQAASKWRIRLAKLRLRLSSLYLDSPLSARFQALSTTRLETLNADAPLPAYAEQLGWMPVEIPGKRGSHYYSFPPERVVQLYTTEEKFRESGAWRLTSLAMKKIVQISEERGIRPIFVYAPSKAHVAMPFLEDRVTGEQLLQFMRYADPGIDDPPELLKKQFFARIDNQERVFMEHCADMKWECLRTTRHFQRAAAAGIQSYYSYDMHWSPEGNRLAARIIGDYLKQNPGSLQRGSADQPSSGAARSRHASIPTATPTTAPPRVSPTQ